VEPSLHAWLTAKKNAWLKIYVNGLRGEELKCTHKQVIVRRGKEGDIIILQSTRSSES
jgi:hypothetical protein